MTGVSVKKATSATDLAHCVQIRTLVFVVGQNVPAEREIDQDEENSTYFLAYIGDRPVGTVRWRVCEGDMAKIERLAVLDTARGNGLAHKLTEAVIEDIVQNGEATRIKIGAQNYIIPFYEKFGFEVVGNEYLDGGTIPHHDMVMVLKR